MNFVDELTSIYEENRNTLVKMYISRAGSEEDAEDMVQEAFYRALKYQDGYDEKYNLGNWLTSILNNCLKDLLKEKRNGVSMGEYVDSEYQDHQVSPCDNDLFENILRDIEATNESQRQILYLYYVKGFTPKSISQILDVKVTKIKPLVWRFKVQMLEKYGELVEDE